MLFLRKLSKYSLLLLVFTLQSLSGQAEVTYITPLEGYEHQIGNLLKWRTSTEHNSQAFVVERSLDGIEYEAIGEVEAAGTSNAENDYRFLDAGIIDNTSYYRLRQVDKDGTISFSQTILLKKEMTNHFMVLSMSNTNAVNTFSMTIDAIVEGEIYYALKSLKGEVLIESSQELSYGLNEVQIDLANEPADTYYVVLKVGDEKEKLVIRKVEGEEAKKENVASNKQQKGG